jgi:hypothetical protein
LEIKIVIKKYKELYYRFEQVQHLNGDSASTSCVEYLYFDKDGSIKPIGLTVEGVSI